MMHSFIFLLSFLLSFQVFWVFWIWWHLFLLLFLSLNLNVTQFYLFLSGSRSWPVVVVVWSSRFLRFPFVYIFFAFDAFIDYHVLTPFLIFLGVTVFLNVHVIVIILIVFTILATSLILFLVWLPFGAVLPAMFLLNLFTLAPSWLRLQISNLLIVLVIWNVFHSLRFLFLFLSFFLGKDVLNKLFASDNLCRTYDHILRTSNFLEVL